MTEENITFKDRVHEIVRKIPRGQIMTYSGVAEMAGNSKAARVVGNILKRNYDLRIPCHRVIRLDGKMSGYNRGGAQNKLKILKEEGVEVDGFRPE